jgi:hypothetical protein
LRAKFLVQDELSLRNWTAFIYFQKGMALLYAGQEMMEENLPDLFDKDTVKWDGEGNLSALLCRLYEIKKQAIFTDSWYKVKALPHDVIYATHKQGNRQVTGVFSVKGKASLLSTKIPDGTYINMIDDSPVYIKRGKISCKGNPIIFESVREDV